MKKSLLLAALFGIITPFAFAVETKNPAGPETKTTEKADPKKPAQPADSETAHAAAKKQAESLTPAQAEKLLELVNKGDAKAIEGIKGIGPKRSKSIIAKRPYSKVEDLAKVDDIGAKTFGDIITFAKGEQPQPVKKEAVKKAPEDTKKMK